MLRFNPKWTYRVLPASFTPRRAGRPGGPSRYNGLEARLERERRSRQIRLGRRVRLSTRDKWVALLLFVLFLFACAAGGWLGLHFRFHEGAAKAKPFPCTRMGCTLQQVNRLTIDASNT